MTTKSFSISSNWLIFCRKKKKKLHWTELLIAQTCNGSFSSVEPSISFTKNWRSSGLPKIKHLSTTLEANFCWLIFTICPASLWIIADRSCGLPCSRTCCKIEVYIRYTQLMMLHKSIGFQNNSLLSMAFIRNKWKKNESSRGASSSCVNIRSWNSTR